MKTSTYKLFFAFILLFSFNTPNMFAHGGTHDEPVVKDETHIVVDTKCPNKTIMVEKTAYLSARELSICQNYTLEWKTKTKILLLNHDVYGSLEVKVGSKTVTMNRVTIDIQNKIILLNGRVLVPAYLINELFIHNNAQQDILFSK